MAEKEKILTAHANNFITFWSILTDFIAIKKQSFCILKIVKKNTHKKFVKK